MVEVVSHENPEYLANRKFVRAWIRFTGTYESGGEEISPINVGLSAITDIEDAVAEGFLLRFEDDPPRVKLLGVDDSTGLMAELDDGSDHSYVDSVRLRVWGW